VSLTELALRNSRTTSVALVLVLVYGLVTYLTLPRAEDPGFIIRVAQVITYFPGASPERVEQLVTDRLEKAIQEMPELKYVSSQSKSGVSVVTAEMEARYNDMRPIWDSLRRKVQAAARDLPEGVRGPFVNDEFGDVFGTVVAITGDGYSYAELKEVADQVRDELLRIDEVAKVEIHGAQEERIFIEYTNARLAELGLSPMQLVNILEARNIVIPGGSVTTGPERIALEPSGSFASVEDLRRTVIRPPGRKGLMYLEDVARVTRGYVDPPQSRMTADGLPALGLAVSMREGGNILRLGAQVEEVVNRLRAAYPIGLEMQLAQFQPMHVERKIDDFVGNLLQAVGVVVVVMMLTLGLRTGLVVATLIPMAILAAFVVMGVSGIGLDQMSLASLIIALGMLVDNAIVMSESIMVRMGRGEPGTAAAVASAGELKVPLLTSSLTTAAAFLPIALAESSTGEYVRPLFWVVTITLLASWVLSLTMVPLLCARFLKATPRQAGPDRLAAVTGLYGRVLVRLLRNRVLTVAAMAGLFALAIWGLSFVPVIFFPPNDRPTFTAELRLPVGTDISRTTRVAAEVDRFLGDDLAARDGADGVTDWTTFVGRGAPRFILTFSPEPSAPEYAVVVANTTSRAAVDTLAPRLEAFARERFPDVEADVRPLQLGPPVTDPIEVRISGRDADAVFGIVERVKARLAEIPGTKNIDDNWGLFTKKLDVVINEARALRAGVTNQDVAVSLQTYLSGIDTTEYREGDLSIPVVLRSVGADRTDVGRIEDLSVFAQATGKSVPLKQVADVRLAFQPAKILRRDRLKTVTVSAGLAPGATALDVIDRLDPWLQAERRAWPPGYTYAYGGELEGSEEANASIMAKVPIGVLIIVMLLVGQFNSLRRPLIILLTIPLGVIGVVAGLLVTGSYFGFMTLLGIISLAGIVINNAIVLIDRIRIEIDENGLDPRDAVLAAARTRLRPILLTTATTIGGLIPLWLGGGPMWEPMAISIIFGLAFATVLTLGLVPVLYSLFFRVSYKGYGAAPEG
jgi:multidrug efflux pump